MLLPLNHLEQIPLETYPYQWCYYPCALDKNIVSDLLLTFPNDSYEFRQSDRLDKSYKMFQRVLYDTRRNGLVLPENLSPLWIRFISALISDNYISKLSALINQDLTVHDIEINCWKYGRGGWLSPHTDKPEKIVSQLFYFNDLWDSKWGGGFRILKSNDFNDYTMEIFPALGNSIILIRSDHSWHCVAEQSSPANVFRNVLQLIFWKRVGKVSLGM